MSLNSAVAWLVIKHASRASLFSYTVLNTRLWKFQRVRDACGSLHANGLFGGSSSDTSAKNTGTMLPSASPDSVGVRYSAKSGHWGIRLPLSSVSSSCTAYHTGPIIDLNNELFPVALSRKRVHMFSSTDLLVLSVGGSFKFFKSKTPRLHNVCGVE